MKCFTFAALFYWFYFLCGFSPKQCLWVCMCVLSVFPLCMYCMCVNACVCACVCVYAGASVHIHLYAYISYTHCVIVTWVVKVEVSTHSKLVFLRRQIAVEGVLADNAHLALATVHVGLTQLDHDLGTHWALGNKSNQTVSFILGGATLNKCMKHWEGSVLDQTAPILPPPPNPHLQNR